MISKESDDNLEGEFKDNHDKMVHYNVMIKNLTEQNKVLQKEIPQLHKQNCNLTNPLFCYRLL